MQHVEKFRVFFYRSRDHGRGIMTSYLGSLAHKSLKLPKIMPNSIKLLDYYILSNAPPKKRQQALKVAPYSFLSARALISKISRWRKLLNSTPKSRAGSRSKMPTNMTSKLLQFVYRKYCVDRFRFQNICRLNRRPQLSLLDVKEKYTRHAGVSTNEADFM